MKYRLARLKRKEILKEKRKPKRSRTCNEDANQDNSSNASGETQKRGDAESNIWNFGKPNINVNTAMLSYGTWKD